MSAVVFVSLSAEEFLADQHADTALQSWSYDLSDSQKKFPSSLQKLGKGKGDIVKVSSICPVHGRPVITTQKFTTTKTAHKLLLQLAL